jgi:O-antigen/teichoic acid export membrane protein
MSRFRFASRNYLSGILFTVVTLLVGFVSTPWVLRWLGEEAFGAFRVTSDWLSYLVFLEFGVGGALLPLLARGLARNEENSVRDLLAAGVRAYFAITSVMLLAGLVLTAFIHRVVAVSPWNISDLRIGCLIGISSLVWLPLASPFRALMDARQRAYWVTLMLGVQSLVATAIALFLAWMGFGITGQFLAWVAGTTVFNATIVWAGMRSHPGVLARAFKGDFDRSRARELWKLNTPTYVLNMCGRVSLLTDNIVVAAMLGPVMVVPLVLTQRLLLMAQGQLQGLGNASWAGLAELYSRGETDIFRRRVVELTNLTTIFAIAVLLPITAFNRPFVSLWVGPNHYGGQWMTLFAMLNAFLLSLISLWGWVFTGTGEVRRIVWPLIWQTIFNFGASVLLTRIVGAVGPLIGTFIGFIAVTAWFIPWQLHKTFGVSARQLVAAVAKPVALGIPYVIALWLFERRYAPSSWFELCGEMLAAALVYLALAWWLVLTDRDRKTWWIRTGLLVGSRRVASAGQKP